MNTPEPNRRQFMAASVAAIAALPLAETKPLAPADLAHSATWVAGFESAPVYAHPLNRGPIARWTAGVGLVRYDGKGKLLSFTAGNNGTLTNCVSWRAK